MRCPTNTSIVTAEQELVQVQFSSLFPRLLNVEQNEKERTVNSSPRGFPMEEVNRRRVYSAKGQQSNKKLLLLMVIEQKVFDRRAEGSEAKSTEQTGAEAEKSTGEETGVGAVANI